LAGAIEELENNYETSSIEEPDNLRLEIEKLRASTEDQILKLRSEYLEKETELLSLLPEEEKLALLNSRPQSLFADPSSLLEEEGKPWTSISMDESKDASDMEARIRGEMENDFIRTEKALVKEYEEKMEAAVREVEIKLNQYWESRAEELEEKIRALEESKPKNSKDLEKKFQSYYDDLLEKSKEELAEELEAKIKEKYENLLQMEMENNSGLDFETENQIRQEMEFAFQQRLRDEKQAWQSEIEATYMHELRKKNDFSLKQKLEAIEEKVKSEASEEINRKIAELQKEADQKIAAYKSETSKEDLEMIKERFKEEFKAKLRAEQDSSYRSLLDPRQKQAIEQDLRKELTDKLEKELYEEAEFNLRSKVKSELAELYKNRQKQLRQDMKNKLKNAEDRLNEQFRSEIEQQVAEIVAKREKELMADYKRQLERNKKEIEAQLTKEFEAKYLKEREALNDELTEITKNKALLTAQLKSVKQQKKEELSKIKKQREEINERLQELVVPEKKPQKYF
jgi:uncharacterized protein with NRDE domain